MIHASQKDDLEFTTPFLPKWVMDAKVPQTTETLEAKCLEEAAFSSGAALSLIHQTLQDPVLNVPQQLLRNRLALKAAKNCLKIERRSSDEGQIRDGFLLAERDRMDNLEQAMGPSGFMYAQWRDHVQCSLEQETFCTNFIGTIPIYTRVTMAEIMEIDQPEVSPVQAATRALSDVMSVLPREAMVALQWADITLSEALGWKFMLPFVGASMTSKELKLFSDGNTNPEELLITVHTAIARSARDAIRLCLDLSRRAAKLKAVAPKLRAKGSDTAVALFLSEDVVSPSTLASSWIFKTNNLMTPRAARRFCDRLVELGVARELTGRSTFRLYGVA
jgi:hypothetical protein